MSQTRSYQNLYTHWTGIISDFQIAQNYCWPSNNVFITIIIQEIENMYRVSIELYKHKWKFGGTRNVVGTLATGECFHRFFKFSQTFTTVCITRQKHEVHVFYFFQKTTRREKGKQLVNFDYQNVNSFCSRHHYVNSTRQFCVCIKLYKHDF